MPKKENLKILIYLIVAVVISVGVSISVQSLLAAWTAPTATPPGGNVATPINEGSNTQVKSGILGITNDFYVGIGNTFFVDESGTTNIGIGTADPKTKLDIDGVIRTRPRLSATCDIDNEGAIYYDSAQDKFRGCIQQGATYQWTDLN